MPPARPVTSAYSAAHFGVDLGCAYAIFRWVPKTALVFLIYNFCAFALQMPLGVLADRRRSGLPFAVSGSLTVAVLCLSPDPGLPGCALLGLGNALFHVGGGLDVLRLTGDRAGPLGVFVSPGAIGLFCGTLLGKGGYPPVLAAALALGTGLLPLLPRRAPAGRPEERPLPGREVLLPALLLFAVVVLRSWAGLAGQFSWKTGLYSLLAVLALALGKTAGGLLADRFGARPVSALSLLAAAGLFLPGDFSPAGLAALLLFNMSMPITLWALARRLPGHEGFAFGALTFALFLGFLPVYLGTGAFGAAELALASLLSCLLLTAGLRERRAR